MWYKDKRIIKTLPRKLEIDGKWVFNPKWSHFEAVGYKEFPESLKSVERRFIKWVDGDPVEMSQEEKDAILAQDFERNKSSLYEQIVKAYEEVELKNITPAGAWQLDEWVKEGNEKALENKQWFSDHYAERLEKLLQVEGGDLTVDPKPSREWKPWSFKDIIISMAQEA